MKSLSVSILLLTVLALTNCGGSKPDAGTPENASTPANAAKDPLASVPAADKEPTKNSADTVAPVLKAYCDALTRKDEAALRAVYSSGSLASLDARMKKENYKSLVEMFEMDQISNKLCEIRNESINGDVAIAELRTQGAPNGIKVKLVKEGGTWKLTNESPELDAVKVPK